MEQFKAVVHDYAPLISIVLTTAISVVTYLLRARVKLIWGQANNSFHGLKSGENTTAVYCEKYYLQNVGRKPATNVEFIFSHPPTEISIWQARDYTRKNTPEGNFMVVIPQIAPKELVIIDSIYLNLRTADVISVKNGETIGKRVNFVVNKSVGKWQLAFFVMLLLGGAAFYLTYILRYFV